MSIFLKYWDRRLPVNVFAIAEQAGLLLAWKSLDGVCEIDNNVIVLNDNESINRQRFAVARILADKESDQLKSSYYVSDFTSGTNANLQAAKILVPQEAFHTLVQREGRDSCYKLACSFDVSEDLIKYLTRHYL